MKTTISEQAVAFDCEGERLIGVLAIGPGERPVAVVVVVGGPQYRVGGHRQFVFLARELASRGFPVLRFDQRGMGDSTGSPRSFETIAPDIKAAIDAVTATCPHIRGIVLLGLCDGASAALMYAPQDDRVLGIALLNPWILSSNSFARSQVRHHYIRRLLQPAFWRKLLRGQVDIADALSVLGRAGRAPRNTGGQGSYQDVMAAALGTFRGNVLLILSGQDPTARSFVQHCDTNARWRGLIDRANIDTRSLPDADHTFSTAHLRANVAALTAEWLRLTFVSDSQNP